MRLVFNVLLHAESGYAISFCIGPFVSVLYGGVEIEKKTEKQKKKKRNHPIMFTLTFIYICLDI